MMTEKQYKELDALFRQAAKQANPPYNHTTWRKMEHMLNKHKRQLFWWKIAHVLMIISITLSAVASIVFHHF